MEEVEEPLKKKKRESTQIPPPKTVHLSDTILETATSPLPSPERQALKKGKEKVSEIHVEESGGVASYWEASATPAYYPCGSAKSDPWAPVDAHVKYVPNWDISQGDELTKPEL